jgi:hypothetical protein
MKYSYSAITGGFYDPDRFPPESLPHDAVQVDNEKYASLFSGQAAGKMIAPDASGNPTLQDPPAPSSGKLWAAHQAQAQAALDASDMTALRCFKAGVAFPSDWLTYVAALRTIVKATTGDPSQALPTRPAYPANT